MTTFAVAPWTPAPATATLRPANRVAESLTGRPYLSHSQISAFRGCPRKFAFEYVEHAPKDFQASSLLLGSAVHAALEFHFRAQLEGLATSEADLLHAFLEKWEYERQTAGADIPIRFNKGEDVGTITDLAKRILAAFRGSPAARPHGRVVGIEESLRVTLDPDLPDLLAKVDLVTETDEALHLVDWKTSRSRWNAERVAESAGQLLLYSRTLRGMSEGLGLPVEPHFVVITKAKNPVIQVLDVPADESRLAAVSESVAQVWSAMRNSNGEGHFASPSPLNCSMCPYKSRCPVFGGAAARHQASDDIPI